MRNLKKIASLLLALALVLSLAVTAFAAEGSININNAIAGQTYKIYRILNLENYDVNAGTYYYKASANWKTFVESATTYFEIDDDGYITWKDGASAADLAAAAIDYAEDNGIAVDDEDTAESATLSFTGLELGYYLVDSSVGILCSLNTTTPSVEINEKNKAPSIDKVVQEDSDSEWGKVNDADMNQKVDFKATITARVGAENYIMHDKMSAGLDFVADSVKIAGLAEGTDYTVVTDDLCENCTFHVVFDESYLEKITADTTIVVEYQATLNASAVVGGEGNPNDAKLTYGDEQNTEWIQTRTYTWDTEVFKFANVKGEDDKVTKKPLAGAEFVLSRDDGKYATVANGKVTGWVDAQNQATKLISGTDGKISITGLDADTYKLTETKAPDGYNLLTEPKEFTITANESENKDAMSYTKSTVEVENKAGAVLPSTGGMGTTLFYVVGGILVAAAVVLLVTKKRMSAE